MQSIVDVMETLIISTAVLTALFMAFLIVISFLPRTNPLRRVLQALELRVGATLAATALAVPTEAIPGIDGLYDIGAPLLLAWYWYGFVKDTIKIMNGERDDKSIKQIFDS